MEKTRILILDADVLQRECLVSLLMTEPDFEVVAACESPEQAVQIIGDQKLDLLLVDYQVPDSMAFLFLLKARRSDFSGHVLLRASELSRESAAHLARVVGADIFPPGSGTSQLVHTIRGLGNGKSTSQRATSNGTGPKGEMRPWSNFTVREMQVLGAVMDGLANKEIAGNLGVSEASVKCTMQQLFRKTGVRTRSQLVKKTLETQIGLPFRSGTRAAAAAACVGSSASRPVLVREQDICNSAPLNQRVL